MLFFYGFVSVPGRGGFYDKSSVVDPDQGGAKVTHKDRKKLVNFFLKCWVHTARIRSSLPLCVTKTGSNHLNEEFTSLLPTGIGERF
jgi:hypothetical protein